MENKEENKEEKISESVSIYVISIGGASLPPLREGQLPKWEHLKEYTSREENCKRNYTGNQYRVKYKFIFIDPLHKNCVEDNRKFSLYRKNGINCKVIEDNFSYETFLYKYNKRNNTENEMGVFSREYILIDYSGYTLSEYDFVKNIGDKKNCSYYTAGCLGFELNMDFIDKNALKFPRYKISGNIPIVNYSIELRRDDENKKDEYKKDDRNGDDRNGDENNHTNRGKLSQYYLQSLLSELNKLCIYYRHIPEKKGQEYPHWLLYEDIIGELIKNNQWDILITIKEDSYNTLRNFLYINNKNIDDIKSENIYKTCLSIIHRVE